MRNIIKITNILILVLISNVYTQDLYNPPKLIETSNNSLFDKNFNQNHFIRGWNWGSEGKELDEALNINYYHNMDFSKSILNY